MRVFYATERLGMVGRILERVRLQVLSWATRSHGRADEHSTAELVQLGQHRLPNAPHRDAFNRKIWRHADGRSWRTTITTTSTITALRSRFYLFGNLLIVAARCDAQSRHVPPVCVPESVLYHVTCRVSSDVGFSCGGYGDKGTRTAHGAIRSAKASKPDRRRHATREKQSILSIYERA